MARRTKKGPGNSSTRPSEVEFHYIKSNFFRVIRADGAIGGITPQGNVHMALFSERAAIPQKIVFGVDAAGRLGEELGREGKNGIVREMEVDVVLDKSAAISLIKWLGEKIQTLTDAESKLVAEENIK